MLSVLNENEHNTGGPRYTKCFDQIRKAVAKVNTYITLAGPEVVGNQYVRTTPVLSAAGTGARKALEGLSLWSRSVRCVDVLFFVCQVDFFLDPKNHDDGGAPDIMSHHAFLGFGSGTSPFFGAIDGFMKGPVAEIVKQRDAVAPKTELVLNE